MVESVFVTYPNRDRPTAWGVVTITAAAPAIPPEVAVILVFPNPVVVREPVLSTVATVGFEEFQVAVCVTSWLVLSVSTTLAASCNVLPDCNTSLPGLMDTLTGSGAVNVNVVEPTTDPSVALIVVVPVPTSVAKPADPGLLLIVATVGSEELQVAIAVRS